MYVWITFQESSALLKYYFANLQDKNEWTELRNDSIKVQSKLTQKTLTRILLMWFIEMYKKKIICNQKTDRT